jgi:hypothetical protein
MGVIKKAIFKIILIGMIFAITGCSLIKSDKMPGIDIPLENMNDKLQLSAPSEINTFTIGDDLGFVIENLSDRPVILPQDYGIQIYEYINNQWEIIENGMEYPKGETEVLPKSNKPFQRIIFSTYPLVFTDQPVKLRVVVVGNYEENGKHDGEEVGAYVEVTIKPK